MFQRFYAVAINTFVETVRQPIYGVILLTTAVLLTMNVSLAAFTLDDDDKLLLDLGLSTLLLSGLFLSAFSAAGILSREIDNKTVLTVISKPVGRPTFVLAKFTGLLAALIIALYLGTLVFILSVRHGVMESSSDPWDAPVLTFGFGSLLVALVVGAFTNYFYGRDFPTTVIAVLAPLLTVAVVLVGKFDEHWEVIPFASNFVGGQIILAAPDIDSEIFARDAAPHLVKCSERITVYASSKDRAIAGSRTLHRYPRLGEAGERLTLFRDFKRIEVVDATGARETMLGHTYFSVSPRFLDDLRGVLAGKEPIDRDLCAEDGYFVFHP